MNIVGTTSQVLELDVYELDVYELDVYELVDDFFIWSRGR